MSEIIERGAKAIYEKWAANRNIGEPWDEVVRLNHSIADEARQEARAVIESMRDPTDAMIDAGGVYAKYSIKAAWQEMIDAALR